MGLKIKRTRLCIAKGEMDRLNFYQETDFAELRRYVKKTSVHDRALICVPGHNGMHPFSLELVISWLLRFEKNKYIVFKVVHQGQTYLLCYAGSKQLVVHKEGECRRDR